MDSTTWYFADQTDATEADSLYEEWYPWVACIIAILGCSGIPGNLLTIAAYWKYESVRTPTNTLIVNQSVGDLFTCLATPLFIFFNYTQTGLQIATTHRYACLASLFALLASLQSSVTNLLGLSVERFVAIFYSLEYYNWVTDQTVRNGIIVMWSIVICFNSLPLLGLNQWESGMSCMPVKVYYEKLLQIFMIIPCMICLIAVTVLSILIAVAATRKQEGLSVPVVPIATIAADKQEPMKKQPKIEYKVTKMLLLVVGAFYACWIPFMIFYGLMLSPPAAWKITGVPVIVSILSEISKGCIAFNAFLNPFIYAYKSSAFKRAYCKLLKIKLHNDSSVIASKSVQSQPQQ